MIKYCKGIRNLRSSTAQLACHARDRLGENAPPDIALVIVMSYTLRVCCLLTSMSTCSEDPAGALICFQVAILLTTRLAEAIFTDAELNVYDNSPIRTNLGLALVRLMLELSISSNDL